MQFPQSIMKWVCAAFLCSCGLAPSALAANSAPELQPRKGLKPFEYIEAPAPLPNYVPNARWGTQGDPIRTMQKPLNPAESAQHLVTFPEFAIELFAAEPEITKPIWLGWDERGRLWIAETVDYPNEMQSPESGRDRIKICEDTNGDGKADKFTVFVDRLSVPTSFVFAGGGLIVVHAGQTELFRDRTGDGKADERTLLFKGWGTGDTHAGPSNFRYGFDNWIWGVVGYSGFRGEVGGKEIRFGQGIFRFKPDGSALEFIRSSNNNTWGLGLSEEGLIFGSTANGNASMHMPIPNRFYELVNGWSAARLESIADSQNIYPITDKVRQVDWHGKYTAGSGSAIYTARQFPREYWNRAQFVAEPTGHLLGKFTLEPKGADFIARNEKNFLASDDEWTSPIAAEVGPDGALWVIDWYNYIIQHNPTPNGFSNGKGNAYETPLRDKKHGRIYRVAYQGAAAARTQHGPLDPKNPAQLLNALKSDNLLWRLHGQRLLVERGQKDVVPALCELLGNTAMDALGLNTAAIHALWTVQGLGALAEPSSATRAALENALKHPSAGVRRTAASVIPRTADSAPALSKLLQDKDAQVRLAALLAVAEMPVSETLAQNLHAALLLPHNYQDRWLLDGITAAAARHDAAFLKAILTAKDELGSEATKITRLVTTHYAQRGATDSILVTLKYLKGATLSSAAAILEGLASGWPAKQAPEISEEDKRDLLALMEAVPESARDRLLVLAQRWGRLDLFADRFAKAVETLNALIANASAEDEARVSAAKRLLLLADQPETYQKLLKEVHPLAPPALTAGLLNALVDSRQLAAAQALLGHWGQYSPAARRAAISALMRKPEWTRAMLDAIDQGAIARTDLAAEHWSQLKQNQNPMIARRAERLSTALGGVSADREQIVKTLLPLAKEKGNPARGKEVFEANCANCHVFAGAGGKIGPDLSGISARDRSDILLEILDPNRSVEANYRLWNATTKDGETISGRLDAETQTTVEILDVTSQKHVLQRKDIARLDASPLSIMPTGFEALPPDDLKALIEYLAQAPHVDSGK